MIQNIKESWLKEILTPQLLEFLSQKRQLSEEIEKLIEKMSRHKAMKESCMQRGR